MIIPTITDITTSVKTKMAASMGECHAKRFINPCMIPTYFNVFSK